MSLQQLWMDLSQASERIGFHTYQTSNMIPVSGGIYAWILPIKFNFNLTDDSLNKNIMKYKKIQAYDAQIEGHSAITNDFKFNWDPLKVEVKKNETMNRIEDTHVEMLRNLSKKSERILKESILLGSLFTRPLYIGYTNNFQRRYGQHVGGYGKNSNFNKRLKGYLNKLYQQTIEESKDEKTLEDLPNEYKIDIRELLFVCISSSNKDVKEDELMLIEEILKTLANPIFSKI